MNIIYTILVSTVWFLSTYFILIFILCIFKYKNELFVSPSVNDKDTLPKVSIVISAFNEENDIAATIDSIRSINYPKELLEVIVVNDGSTDKTKEVIQSYIKKNEISFIDNVLNKGKAACLNQGIAAATGELVACMDADTVAEKDILQKIVVYFKDKTIGAVTVPVEVKNPKNLLEKVIDIEYVIGLSLFLKAFSYFDSVHVTPGPFSIYRKKVLDEIGGFDPTNITEDLEIAYRLHKGGYRIACCMTTRVYTIIPNTVKKLYRQRKRWYSGALLTAAKHRDMLLKKKYGLFAFFVPLNFAIILSGLGLFLYSIYLVVSNTIKNISLYALTNYNFFAHFLWSDFDILNVSILNFFGVSSILCTIVILLVSFYIVKKSLKNRVPGSIGFVFLFFLYQFFWFMSVYTVLVKRKLKW